MNAETSRDPVLVLGVGNLLVGDEGVGVHVVRALEDTDLPESATLLDGGTGGFHLLGHLNAHRRVILVDATRDGSPPGTVAVFRPRRAADFPEALGAHDIGLKDLIAAAALLEELPEITVVTIAVAELKPMTTDLSPEVAAAIPEAIREIRSLLQ